MSRIFLNSGTLIVILKWFYSQQVYVYIYKTKEDLFAIIIDDTQPFIEIVHTIWETTTIIFFFHLELYRQKYMPLQHRMCEDNRVKNVPLWRKNALLYRLKKKMPSWQRIRGQQSKNLPYAGLEKNTFTQVTHTMP